MERRAKRTAWMCCCCIFILLVSATILVLVLRSLLRPKNVQLKVKSLTLQELDARFNLPTLRPSLKLTLHMQIFVYNPNRASFSYRNSTVLMFYHGDEAARTYVPAGSIAARGRANIPSTLVVSADKVVASPYLSADVQAGVLPVQTRSSVRGRVNVWNLYKHDMVSESRCEILLGIANQTVISYECDTKNRF